MISGSAGQEIPDEHFVRSIKVFDPTQKEEKSLHDFEAERVTVEYVKLEDSHMKDIIHEKAPEESVSHDSLMGGLNGYLRGQK